MTESELRKTFAEISAAALVAADPRQAVHRALKDPQLLQFGDQSCRWSQFRHVWLVGLGKAAGAMAAAVEESLGDRLNEGWAVTKAGSARTRLKKTSLKETGHPEPDSAGLKAAASLGEFLGRRAGPEDLVLLVVSGGGSALLPSPPRGIPLEDKTRLTRLLLKCGADIREINTVRRHVSHLKGGRLLRLCGGAHVLSLLLSDVPGDDPADIAGGPTAPDSTMCADALEILSRYGLKPLVPASVLHHLEGMNDDPATGETAESLKPDDPLFQRTRNIVVANNRSCLEAAAARAAELGFSPVLLVADTTQPVEDFARLLTSGLRNRIDGLDSPLPPCCLLAGGEVRVKVQGPGLGGRNQHLALACLREIRGWPPSPVLFGALATDGNDGPTAGAGAIVTGSSARRATELGLSITESLLRYDSYNFFTALGDCITTGPTGTNVMDLYVALAGPPVRDSD